jgi:hypothetical protein
MINMDNKKSTTQLQAQRETLAMLLLLRRPLRDAVTFCAFAKIWEKATAEKRSREKTIGLRKEGARKPEN